MDIDREKLAWAAGFFDGEGSFLRYDSRGYARVSITQVHRPTLERFQAAVGGIGYITGPHQPKAGTQEQYRYVVSGFEKVQYVACMLWPWLGDPKKEQARRILTTCARSHSRTAGARCRRGHVFAEVGRTKWGQCRGCLRVTDKNRRG